jgi:predicted DCC family thiol-disulfide oxidoreductase YuxK
MIPIDMARDPNTWAVLYDRDCGFCRWSLAQLLALDRRGRLRPVALGTPEADTLLAELTPEQRASSWHLVSADGRRWSAGAAAPPLLRLLPGGRAPAAPLALAPRGTERVYRWVADHRSTLSRLIPASSKRRADARIADRQAT